MDNRSQAAKTQTPTDRAAARSGPRHQVSDPTLDALCINTLRFLAVDAVEKAKSGHPGAPLGAMPMVYTLWDRFLNHNPRNPHWPNRDRFVLSAGHASAMLYALLHMTGYDLSLEDLKRFRQLGSKTPGHPEYGDIPGVEATTGPLGQGFANAVGMAVAERALAKRFNRPGFELFDHHTYIFASDGDMMEGVASEAASLAGMLKLGKLICLYDDNNITIEGDTQLAFREDVGARFKAYGWRVIGPIDGMDTRAAAQALQEACSSHDMPTLIVGKTVIGFGSPHKAGTASAHGEALGAEEVKLTKQQLGWPYLEEFTVPPEAAAHTRLAIERGLRAQQHWEGKLEAYRATFPVEALHFNAVLDSQLPSGWDAGLDALYPAPGKSVATRDAGGLAMNLIASRILGLTGGSADLGSSTKTLLKDGGDLSPEDPAGRNWHFGVREHAMGAIANGLALHGGFIPYTSTFLIFSDYMRPPIRLAAMMRRQVIHVFTHDSIGLGEDGPTHQPIEQLIGLRAIPNNVVIRPADATETVEAWKVAIQRRTGPTTLVLTRQAVPVLDRAALAPAAGLHKGAYVLWDSTAQPAVILIATGSEVHLALDAARALQAKGLGVRVVSMPSWELFEAQQPAYKHSVLPQSIAARLSIEAASTLGWDRYIGPDGVALGLSTFGVSAPYKDAYAHFGLTVQRIADEAERLVAKLRIR